MAGGRLNETWLQMEVQLLYWNKTLDDITYHRNNLGLVF